MFKIYDGRFEFYQWDLDRKIIVADPAITEVHFCNKTDDCSLVVEVYELGGKRVANVPNILLQENWDIRVYGYCGECYTKTAARFKVVGRTKPADYVYTETEVKSWETMEKRCEEVLELAETLSKGAIGGESFMDYEALITNLNTAEKNKYYSPQHLLIRTLDVPDLWIYEVKEESVTYEYVDDQTFAQSVTDGLVQVGYFVLSALETGKVDLTDYVKFTDYATSNKAGVVKTNNLYGIQVEEGTGALFIRRAREEEIRERGNQWTPITPENLDYAMMSALAECKKPELWTDDSTDENGETVQGTKTKSRELLGAVGKEERASQQNYGLVTGRGSAGVWIQDGKILVTPTSENDIAGRMYYGGFTPKNLEDLMYYGILGKKVSGGVTTYGNQRQIPDEEKQYALDWLGAVAKTTTPLSLYGTDGSGNQYVARRDHNVGAYTIVSRDGKSRFAAGTPENDDHVTTKKYVDDLIANLQAQINELKGV